MKFFPSLLVALLVVTSASALEWQTQKISLKAAPLDRTAQTTFDFTNKGDKTVTITSVDTSCDCLDARPSAKSFAPGASGQITARFTLGDRVGSFSRTIIVSTDDGEAPTALSVEMEIADVAVFFPRVLDWKLKSKRTEQFIDVFVASGVQLNLTAVQSTSDAFKLRLETLEPGRHYRLHVKPESTKAVANAAFRVTAKASTGEELVLSAYGNVR